MVYSKMYILVMVLVCNVLITFAASGCIGSISDVEFEALHTIFDSTGGNQWQWNTLQPPSTLWTFPNALITPCSHQWQGLSCRPNALNASECYIVSIHLDNYNLNGSIPTVIGNFSALGTLNLNSNNLTGVIPSEIGLLTVLQVLSLNNNALEGSMPTELSQITSLQALDLNNNLLVGTIPTELGQLNLLYQFYLFGNSLVGSIPTELGQMSAMVELGLNNNKLQGSIPTELGRLSSAALLTLNNNNLIGSIPTELGRLSVMQQLDLYSNHLVGSIPSELAQLLMLTELDLSVNQLVGSIPSEFGQLSSLQTLYLSSNLLNGSIPSEFGQLAALQELGLNSNKLTGVIPTELGQLNRLQGLYLFINRLVGLIPTVFGQMTSLQTLTVYSNSIVGSIPSELGLLSALNLLDVSQNCLFGTIPTELGQLSSLQEFILVSNFLNGTIPTQLGNLTAVVDLLLYNNNLTGTIPTELGQLTAIQELALYTNHLIGTIPTELGQLSAILTLNLNDNYLQGSIPTELGQLSTMTDFGLYSNCLQGSIPTEFGLLSSIEELNMYSNRFVGTIPTEFGLLSALQILDFFNNDLVGSIPTVLCQLINLQQLDIDYNFLFGSIPTCLGLLTAMEIIALNSNNLIGPIPTELGNLLAMRFLGLFNNQLTCTIPSEIVQMTSMQMFQMEFNLLTGSIIDLTNTKSLQIFNVSFNLLSGAMPTFPTSAQYISLSSNYFSNSIANYIVSGDRLRFLDISDNAISGSIPAYFTSWRLLQSLNLSTNLLSRSIDNLIFRGGNSTLQSLDASKNLFSGSLPGAFFLQRSLRTVLLFENCFSGSIPSTICDNSHLQALFLDSLTGNCGSAVPVGLRSVMRASVPKLFMQGGIPSCVWSMPELQLLRLSGNGLKGSLGDISTNSSLSVLVLSSNLLTGSIPSSWQSSGQWSQLDLSSNKLSGVLSESFAIAPDSALLDLTVNRLSGRLPSVFANVSHPLSVLDGNLFQCQAGNLPQQDPDHDGYVCGADDLDTALEFALVAVGLALVGLCVVYYRRQWLQSAWAMDVTILKTLRHDVAHLRAVASLQAVLTVVLYSTFKMVDSLQTFSSHSEQYMWTPTAAFLHGWGPVLLVSLLLLVTGWLWQMNEVRSPTRWYCAAPSCQWRWSEIDMGAASKVWGKYLSVHVMNVAVVVAVNAAYVNAVLVGLSEQNLFAIQFMLSLFKLIWNSIAVPYFAVAGECATSDRLFMSLFAFIGGPFISTFFTSSNCFRNLFTGESSVQSTANVQEYDCNLSCYSICLTSDNCQTFCPFGCVFAGSKPLLFSLFPPWTYSYQCASSLLTNYLPVMIVTFAISGAVLPLLELTYFSMPADWVSYVTHSLPLFVVKKVMHGTLFAANREQVLLLKEDAAVINANRIRLQHLLHVAVLLTFGIASPLLSVLIGIGAAMQCALWHVSVGRLFDMLVAPRDPDDIDGKINDYQATLLQRLETVEIRKEAIEMRIVMVSAGLFWGYFVFDMMGDVYGSVVGGLSVLAPFGVSLVVIIVGANAFDNDTFNAKFMERVMRQLASAIGLEMITINTRTLDNPQNTMDDYTSSKDVTSIST